MSGSDWGAVALLGSLVAAALGDVVSEEIRGWLDLAPHAILRLAAAQLDPTQRETLYEDEWLPELCYVLRGAEARPITRLIRGTTFSLGLLISARRIARHLSRTPITQPAPGAPSSLPSRRGQAPLPRQIVLALLTAALGSLPCYFAALALYGSVDETFVWAGLFLAALAGGEVALDFYRDRHGRARRALVILLGAFVSVLGVLRFTYLATVGTSGLVSAAAGALLFTAATAGFIFLGDRALLAAETPQAWRARRAARTAVMAPFPTPTLSRARQLAVYIVTSVGQVLLAVLPVTLEYLVCYLAAQALDASADATLMWAGVFLLVLVGGEVALCVYRTGHRRATRFLIVLLGAFFAGLGVLRYSYLAQVEVSGVVVILVEACLLTAVTAGCFILGFLSLRAAETLQVRRRATWHKPLLPRHFLGRHRPQGSHSETTQ
jgi:hypothetical protein